MDPLKMIHTSIFQLLSIFFVIIYLLGILNTYFSDKNDYCEMTYMFEYPQFIRITLQDATYPEYGLYAYAEGRMTEKVRKMRFDGIPVLYLPGNSGSHMQSRSLASVALRKAISDSYDYHFDFFAVSYNEDLSGVYGGVLHRETYFAAICINQIMELYKHNTYTKSVPTQVILIGHSMGGVIAKRLLAYPRTLNVTNIAIALAAPLEAPVANTDREMNTYYRLIDTEWEENVHYNSILRSRKMLLSFGNGARDTLMPSGLTYSDDSDVNALITAVPGVWMSPDHVSVVWCKQFVLAINRFLFSIVDPQTKQVIEDKKFLMDKARHFFQANRSMTLDPNISRPHATMIPDAFWYEDNRRVYQISRPEISKMTYLMIRLVNFPQNRFVAIESVNVDDKDWIFGCSAQHTYGMHRYCKQATSLTELSRWSGAAKDFGRRKLATVHLHDVMAREPGWTHVIVKVSPTRKPIILNVDVNDLASRQITVNLPSGLSFGKTVVLPLSEPGSLYYEIILPGFDKINQAYLLYVEPTAVCQAKEYHITAEVHVPWAPNHEYFHYFTHLKRSPMKLRLFKSKPSGMRSDDTPEHVKVTLLLDPQCFFTISVSHSWYHRLAQFARNYTPVLIPYMAAALLLAARASIENIRVHGNCVSLHSGLNSEYVKPYYALLASRILAWLLASLPVISFIVEKHFSSNNHEIDYLTGSLLSLPVYMTAVGLSNILVAAVILVMVFSSQLTHRMFYRILWRGAPALAERAAEGIKRIPFALSIVLTLTGPFSCGAASLAIGAAYYAFLISKMYESYLEDYVYKLMAKVASRICFAFRSGRPTPVPTPAESRETPAIENKEPNELTSAEEIKAIKYSKSAGDDNRETTLVKRKGSRSKDDLNTADSRGAETTDEKDLEAPSKTDDKVAKKKDMIVKAASKTENKIENKEKSKDGKGPDEKSCDVDADDDEPPLDLHFHVMMFCLWMVVTLINIPALVTWARNFQYNMMLFPDTSHYPGLVMSACSANIWQMAGPRQRLKHYDTVSAFLLTVAIFILALGPQSLTVVNYGVTFVFAVITLQQVFDSMVNLEESAIQDNDTNAKVKTERNAKSSEQNATTGSEDHATCSEVNSTSLDECSADSEESAESGEENGTTSEGKSSNTAKNESVSTEKNQSGPSEKGEQTPSANATSSDNSCDVCNENYIYNMFKNLREKFTFNEDL